jgi:UDP-N-acetylglucosamine--N-acetylmuramyl-(pentapeptide) pyrophosphoryl-undecaprenol N-acetylglucosamine transferase
MGGSLGAKSINQAMSAGLSKLIENGIQVIWQTGKGNLNLIDPALRNNKMGCITEFITKMDYAYAAADLVVSRAGAIAIAEICATGKASILVPYPLAAEDHQTANAMTLVKEGAAILIKDAHVTEQLTDTIVSMIKDKEKIKAIGHAASKLFTADADARIAKEIINSVNES